MEVYYMVLFCVLVTTAASLSSLDGIAESVDDDLALNAQAQRCNCKNGRCFTDNEGHTKCSCNPGFSLQGEFTCKPCDCGPVGKCIFIIKPTDGGKNFLYQKKCVCDVGDAEKDGRCVDCFCGENSACDFQNGERNCYCVEGYSDKKGICTQCDCGFYGKCEYENGNKKCTCDEGYLELNGTCEECYCGDHGNCSFEKGQKTCKCQAGFSLSNGKCEQCDCGDRGSCSFQNGQKTCTCQPGYSVNTGKCEPCDCGSNSEYCGFVNGVKHCTCKDKYADRHGTCEECYCGAYSRSCSFNNNQKTCSCLEGYVQKDGICQHGCTVENPCQNGGYCKEGFCWCHSGTRGNFCEVIEGCPDLCPDQSDIRCSYDVVSLKAYCRCPDSDHRYDPITKVCKSTCKTDKECMDGVCREGACECLPGTWGDRCEIVDCVTGAIKCNQMDLIWKGSDALYIIWEQKLLKFVRRDLPLPYVDDCPHAKPVKCRHRYDILWCGGNRIYVPTSRNKMLRYLIEDSTGSRCSSSVYT